MIQRMEQLASTYFIGALFIDELQHLNAAKTGGKDNMLNFFVNLINSIGIPVVFVGTNSMVNLFSDVMRNARRACGLGMYDFKQPMQDDPVWDMLVDATWSYQWVQKPAQLTPEIRSVLYEHTQGITDFLAKLMILGQRYAIQAKVETLTPETFTHVANTKMKLLKPALTVLKSRDVAAMKKFEDLLPLDEQLEGMMSHQAPQISVTAWLRCAPPWLQVRHRWFRNNVHQKRRCRPRPETFLLRSELRVIPIRWQPCPQKDGWRMTPLNFPPPTAPARRHDRSLILGAANHVRRSNDTETAFLSVQISRRNTAQPLVAPAHPIWQLGRQAYFAGCVRLAYFGGDLAPAEPPQLPHIETA